VDPLAPTASAVDLASRSDWLRRLPFFRLTLVGELRYKPVSCEPAGFRCESVGLQVVFAGGLQAV